jgi:hypothetical protein
MLGARTCEPRVREEAMAATVRESEVWEGRCVGAWARTVSKSRAHVWIRYVGDGAEGTNRFWPR